MSESQAVLRERKETPRGLKKLRAKSSSLGPTEKCSNCGCTRYSPCYCAKPGDKPQPGLARPERLFGQKK